MNHQDQILISLIETWNNENLLNRLNPELIKLINDHIGYAYTVGTEQMNKKIVNRLELITNEAGQIHGPTAIQIIKKL